MKIDSFLNEGLLFLVYQAHYFLGLRFKQELEGEGFSFLSAVILSALYFEKDRAITPDDLLRSLKTSKANLSHAISNLESLELVKRIMNEEDARSFSLILTAKGKRKSQSMIALLERVENEITQELGKGTCKSLGKDLKSFLNYLSP